MITRIIKILLGFTVIAVLVPVSMFVGLSMLVVAIVLVHLYFEFYRSQPFFAALATILVAVLVIKSFK